MKWSIDSADAYAIARTRRAVVEELARIAGDDADLFGVESVLGELLIAQMERGHLAVAIVVELESGGPAVHVYAQGQGNGSKRGRLRESILRKTPLPMSVDVSDQGTHYCLSVPRGGSDGK